MKTFFQQNYQRAYHYDNERFSNNNHLVETRFIASKIQYFTKKRKIMIDIPMRRRDESRLYKQMIFTTFTIFYTTNNINRHNLSRPKQNHLTKSISS